MKRAGKNKPNKKVPLSVEDRRDFDAIHRVLEERNQMTENTKNAQEYVDKMKKTYQSYTSRMKEIRENLDTAKEGLAAIDEKGMSDKIIEAINKISEVRNKQIEATSEYSTQIVSFDSARSSYIREHGDNRSRFVVDKFDEMVKERNAKLREDIGELDRQYREIETNLYKDDNGKHHEPTDDELLQAKRAQDKLLEQKQALMSEYAGFLQKTAVERDEILTDRKDDVKPSKEPVQNEFEESKASEETKAKKKKITTAFTTAENAVHSKWEQFKSLPVIAQLTAGGAMIGRKVAPKLDVVKSDLLAGYAAIKERKQVRKAERVLTDLDKLQGKEGSDSHLSRFKDSLSQGSGKIVKEPEPAHVEVKSEETVPETPVKKPDSTVDVKTEETVSEPVSPESLHESRIRKAGNKAVLRALDDTGLRRMINDYYWSDMSETHDIMTELSSSENVMIDVTKYVDRVKGMINHWPNETYRKAMIEKLDAAMTETYAAKVESERKVSSAEARIRDSEEFLRNLDQSGVPVMSGPEEPTV